MFLTKLFLATILVVALSAQAVITEPKAPHDEAFSIIKKHDKKGELTQITEALNNFKDGASKFDLLAANLEKSLGCLNSVSDLPVAEMEMDQLLNRMRCRITIRQAQISFDINHGNIFMAKSMILYRIIVLLDLADELAGIERAATQQYAKYLKKETDENFTERYIALTTKTIRLTDLLMK